MYTILKRNFIHIILPILFWNLFFPAFSQTSHEIDSLKQILPAYQREKKVDLLNKIVWGHIQTDRKWDIIDSLGREALRLSESMAYNKGKADALLNLSFSAFNLENNIKKSSELLMTARNLYSGLYDTLGLAWTNQQIGYNCFFLGQLAEMKEYYLLAHKYFFHIRNYPQLDWLLGSTSTYFAGYTKLNGEVAFYNELLNDYKSIGNEAAVVFYTSQLSKTYLGYKAYDSALIVIQSIINQAKNLPDIPEKANYYFQWGSYYKAMQKPDSAIFYLEKAEDITLRQNNLDVIVKANFLKIIFYMDAKRFDTADSLGQIHVGMLKKLKSNYTSAAQLGSIGFYFYNANNYALALKYYYEYLKSMQEIGFSEEIATAYAYISDIYNVLKEYDKALENGLKALDALPFAEEDYVRGYTISKIGYIYYLKEDYKLALQNLQIADSILTATNLQRLYLPTVYWQGLTYLKLKDYDNALAFFQKAVSLKSQLGVKIQLSSFSIDVYTSLAKLYIEKNDYAKALEYIKISEAEYHTDAIRTNRVLMDIYYIYYQIYKAQNNKSVGFDYLEKYLELKTKVEDEDNNRKITNLEIQAATEKKEAENELLRKDNLLKEKEARQQAFTRNVLISGILLLMVLVFIVLRSYKQKQKANKLLQQQRDEIVEKNAILSQQKEEIRAQAENLEIANVEITAQRDELERSHRHITDSITYAQRIQQAVLPANDVIANLFLENFVLFKPRDIVSGDFYFVKSYKNYVFLAAADCTGHGVPGAFMSMLGVALLNEIIRRTDIMNSAQVLDELRKQVKNSLQQKGQQGEQQDGIDIALVAINTENQQLSYAGAYNSLIIFRNGQMHELKADRMPVGIYRQEHPFTNQNFQLMNDDVLYLFSDGYYSQFKSDTKQTMKIKQFRELLAELQMLNFTDQKNELENYFNAWKGTQPQVDDVLVLGVKFNSKLHGK